MINQERRRDLALLLLRLAGVYLAFGHGWGKINGLIAGTSRFPASLEGMGFPFPVAFAWAAAVSEFAGGLLIAAGLFTRWAALFAGVTMLVAAFLRHRAFQQFLGWIGVGEVSPEQLRAWGSPELSLIFLLVWSALFLMGPGGWSLDARLRRKKK